MLDAIDASLILYNSYGLGGFMEESKLCKEMSERAKFWEILDSASEEAFPSTNSTGNTNIKIDFDLKELEEFATKSDKSDKSDLPPDIKVGRGHIEINPNGHFEQTKAALLQDRGAGSSYFGCELEGVEESLNMRGGTPIEKTFDPDKTNPDKSLI
jgi:hypothetical protein